MIALIALIVGGAGSFVGATLGGVALGLLQHLSAAAIATEWQDAIVFAVLIVFLICRPCGLFGSPLRQRTI
jgi:branched-chain amino acid transport system permease protein